MLSIAVRVRAIPGGWRVSVGRDGHGAVDADVGLLPGLVEQVHRLLAPPVVAFSDVQRSAAEEAAGRCMLDALFPTPVLVALHGLLGEARGARALAVLLVDAPELDLPWELLGSEGPFPNCVVARRGGRALSESPVPAVRSAEPDGDDPVCAARIESLHMLWTAVGLAEGAGAVCHLVAHGDRDDVLGWLSLPEGDQAAGTTAATLPLQGTALVVLEVCDAGASVDGLAQRLLDRTASVIAPCDRWSAEAAAVFSEGLYGELAEGGSLAQAVFEGRRRIRELGRAHPDGRWHTPLWWVAGDAAAGLSLSASTWQVEGWQLQDPALRRWLQAAREIAEPHGFVGLEHLLATAPTGPGWLAQLQLVIAGVDPLGGLRGLQVRDRAPDWRGSPRLREATPVDGVLQFAEWLCTGLDGALEALMDTVIPSSESGATMTLSVEGGGTAATGVEVLGGPEDGRWFDDGAVGRASEGEGLYEDTVLTDPYLARRMLTLGEVWTLRKPAQVVRGGNTLLLAAGVVHVCRGDLLRLSKATRLRAR